MMSLRPVLCPLCGADDAELLFPASGRISDAPLHDMLACTSTGLAQHDAIVRCRKCAMVYVSRQPTAEALTASYSKVCDPTYVQQRGGRERTFGRFIDRIHHYAKPPGTMLDIGCYTGVLMELAAERGWTVSGVELSEWAVKIARTADVGPVHQGTLEQAPIAAGSMDLVTLLDVIEHLSDPASMIEHIATILRPGGLFALTTHMIDSPTARVMGKRYPFLMDMHLVHFARDTMTKLLSQSGFEVLMIESHRRTVMADYLLNRVWNLVPALSAILRPISRARLLRRIPVHIRGLGLVNIFARKK